MIGIIGAMNEEITEILSHCKEIEVMEKASRKFYKGKIDHIQVIVALAGIGKVNAALTTTLLIENFNVDYIINLGVAGGVNGSNHKDIVIGREIVYHDVDVTKFGNYVRGQVPGSEAFYIADPALVESAEKAVKNHHLAYHIGRIASGDQFVYQKNIIDGVNRLYDDIYAVEMEAAAIAHIATIYQKPFLIIRSISDVLEDLNQHLDYEEFLSDAVKNATTVLLDVIHSI
jgi:adenosylhomocysteine nucleosidase